MPMSEKDQWLQVRQMELPITLRVLKAFPADKLDYRPHPKSRSAKELAWVFVQEEGVLGMMIKGKVDFGAPSPPAPNSLAEILATYEKVFKQNNDVVKGLSDSDLNASVDFPVGPGKMMAFRRMEAFWIPVMDAVHHRGQMSVYIRPAGGKVPSIYGPTADETWM